MKFQHILFSGILFSLLTLNSCTLSKVDEPCSITGIVTNNTGNGIPEVAVHIVSRLSNYEVKTLNDGTYIVDIPNAGMLELTFTKAGYISEKKTLVVVGGEKKELDIVLQ